MTKIGRVLYFTARVLPYMYDPHSSFLTYISLVCVCVRVYRLVIMSMHKIRHGNGTRPSYAR